MKTNKFLYFCSLLGLLFCATFVKADDEYVSVYQYIDEYKDIAIAEMRRTGIPASIKMGQAILESNHGNSKLARNSNNHFGIKCKKEWTGKEYYHKDDDRDKRGRLIKSCFRAYGSVPDSYIDHSNFLLTRERYAGLFKLHETDYKGWAKELKRSGYATANHYADKLIQIIEDNQLYTLDFRNADPMIAKNYADNTSIPLLKSRLNLSNVTFLNKKAIIPIIQKDVQEEEYSPLDSYHGRSYFPKKYNQNGIFLINGLRTVSLQDGQTLEELAKKFQIPVKKLLKYNDLSPNDKLLRGQYIFLMPKAKAFENYDYHRVKSGESLYIISQLYGIELKKLEKRNRISEKNPVREGMMIKLNGKKIKETSGVQQNFNVKKRG